MASGSIWGRVELVGSDDGGSFEIPDVLLDICPEDSDAGRIDDFSDFDMFSSTGIASPKSVAKDPNPSPKPKSSSLAEIAIWDWSGVTSMSDDGAEDDVSLDAEDGGPPDSIWIDRIAARFFRPGDRPRRDIVSHFSGLLVALRIDSARRTDLGGGRE